MLLDWKIRYLDPDTKTLKDRWVYLLTEDLEPATQAAVELFVEDELPRDSWAILRFRKMFKPIELDDLISIQMRVHNSTGVGPSDYFEDAEGNPLTVQELIRRQTGNDDAIVLPSSGRSHDAELIAAGNPKLDVEKCNLTEEQMRVLAYFTRDLDELLTSEFLRQDSPKITTSGSFPSDGKRDWKLTTAATDEEIRSFVTIFRRLYMGKEVGCYEKAIKVFTESSNGTPHAVWAEKEAKHVSARLQDAVWTRPFFQGKEVTFTRKRLLDVFIYTQYAHQPDTRRQRQFGEVLNEVSGMSNLLTWLFLRELTDMANRYARAGTLIQRWFALYCDTHQATPKYIESLRLTVPGIGDMEKADIRSARLRQERIESLARQLRDAEPGSANDMDHYRELAATMLNQAISSLND